MYKAACDEDLELSDLNYFKDLEMATSTDESTGMESENFCSNIYAQPAMKSRFVFTDETKVRTLTDQYQDYLASLKSIEPTVVVFVKRD
jgi:hypothetical protein